MLDKTSYDTGWPRWLWLDRINAAAHCARAILESMPTESIAVNNSKLKKKIRLAPKLIMLRRSAVTAAACTPENMAPPNKKVSRRGNCGQRNSVSSAIGRSCDGL
jgi:hypothetical protein